MSSDWFSGESHRLRCELELAEELGTAFQLCDQFTYDNVFIKFQPGSGKTTLGKRLAEWFETPFFIDGDEFRSLFGNTNYGKMGRENNIRNSIAVATYLNKKGQALGSNFKNHSIVVSMVNPYERLRKELAANNPNQTILVLLKSNRDLRREYHVSNFEDGKPNLTLSTDKPEEVSFHELTSFVSQKQIH